MDNINFINRAKHKFGDKLDFSKSDVRRMTDPIIYTCNIHGVQKATPEAILRSNTGCKECGARDRIEAHRTRFNKFKNELPKQYTFLKEVYTGKNEKADYITVKLRCNNDHNGTGPYEFNTRVIDITTGKGCPLCARIKTKDITDRHVEDLRHRMSESSIGKYATKVTKLIQDASVKIKARGLNPDDYDFSMIDKTFTGMRSKIQLKCNLHGTTFTTTAEKLKLGRINCPECRKQMNTKHRLRKTIDVVKRMGERCNGIDFTKVLEKYPDILRAKDRILIKCKDTGKIMNTDEDSVMRNTRCPCDNTEIVIDRTAITYDDFVKQADELFDGKFKYKRDTWKGARHEMTMWHPKVGIFKMIPRNHLKSKYGHVKLANEHRADVHRHTTETFIEKLEDMYGKGHFLTDRIKYGRGNKDPVEIGCDKHAKPYYWKARPNDLMLTAGATGCPRCNSSSTYEEIVHNTLDDLKDEITIIREYKLPELEDSDKENRLYRYDFYIPELRMLIEYDGDLHEHNIAKRVTDSGYNRYTLDEIKQRDVEKTKLTKSHGYYLLRIPHTVTEESAIQRTILTYLNRTYPYRYNGIWYNSDVSIREALEAKELDNIDLKKYRYTWKLKDIPTGRDDE